MIVMLLKQMTAAGHDRAAALYTRVAARFGSQDAAGQKVGYLIVPEPCETAEEWAALYSPNDEPPPLEPDECG